MPFQWAIETWTFLAFFVNDEVSLTVVAAVAVEMAVVLAEVETATMTVAAGSAAAVSAVAAEAGVAGGAWELAEAAAIITNTT